MKPCQKRRKKSLPWMKSRLRRLDCLKGKMTGYQALRAFNLRHAIAEIERSK